MASDREWRDAEDSRPVALADIDLEDERFRITTRRSSDDLLPSIRRFGLRRAPLVACAPAGFFMVSGFRRVHACRALGWETIPARVIARAACEYECALKAVAENSLERPLNLIETSRALHLLESHAPDGRIPAADAAALGLPTHPELASRLKLLCGMPAVLQEALLQGALSFAMACELGRMEEGLGVAFARLFLQLKPSLNKQREIVALVLEIACREDADPRQLLEEAGQSPQAGSADPDRNQQIQRLRRELRRRRFPAVAAAEDNFLAVRQRLKLGDALQLAPPRDFEGTRFTLTLSFENRDDLARLQARLHELIDHPDFKTLLAGKGRGFERATGG